MHDRFLRLFPKPVAIEFVKQLEIIRCINRESPVIGRHFHVPFLLITGAMLVAGLFARDREEY